MIASLFPPRGTSSAGGDNQNNGSSHSGNQMGMYPTNFTP